MVLELLISAGEMSRKDIESKVIGGLKEKGHEVGEKDVGEAIKMIC